MDGAGAAFCPAHITGFFKPEVGGGRPAEERGSTGAGFSVGLGVATTARASRAAGKGRASVTASGYAPGDAAVSEWVASEFLGRPEGEGMLLEVHHAITAPVGYGLGCSGAAALSAAMALNEALGAGLSGEEAGRVAHAAELECGTGLGDVLAAYHGGLEVRTVPGAPGTGRVERMGNGASEALLACFAPVSTKGFMARRLGEVNGLGGRMLGELAAGGGARRFQEMSMEFARHLGVVTPRMGALAADLRAAGLGCGVALFGETVFSLAGRTGEADAAERIMRGHRGAAVLRAGIERRGARLVGAAGLARAPEAAAGRRGGRPAWCR